MLAELKRLEADHPEICKLYDIGDSPGKQYFATGKQEYASSNHDIWALKVSRNLAVEEDEPNIIYSGGHHAREPISLEVRFAVLNHIFDEACHAPGIPTSGPVRRRISSLWAARSYSRTRSNIASQC
jgi:hypothetical protein